MYTILLVGSNRDDIYLSLFEAVVRWDDMVIDFEVNAMQGIVAFGVYFAMTLTL